MTRRPEVFAALKTVLTPLAERLAVTANTPSAYALDLPGHRYRDKATTPFAWVKDCKSYVSFHVFPVYMMPDLLDGVSDRLRSHMQGKSCFNFKTLDPGSIAELKIVVERSEARFRAKLETRERPRS